MTRSRLKIYKLRIKELTNNIGPLAAQSLELPLPYSAPASTIVSSPEALYL
jgi:hypothetical protein